MAIEKGNKILIVILSFFLFLYIWSCNTDKNEIPAEISGLENLIVIPTNIQPTYDITIQKDKVFGDFEREAGVMGGIGDIAVDDSGRVFISDTQQKTIHVFNPDGEFLQTLGRSGSGPGEFGHIFDMKIEGNKLFAFDPTFYRLNFYSIKSLTFDHVEELFFQDWSDYKNIEKASPTKFYDWSNTNLLIGFEQVMGENIYYYVVNNSGHRTKIISDPILVQKKDVETKLTVKVGDEELAVSPPFARKSLMAVSKERHIFAAWTNLFLIKEYDPKGRYLRVWYYPHKRQPLTQADLDSFAASWGSWEASIQKALSENEPPRNWPALDDLRIDDQNRLWVSTIVKDHSVTEWWILEMDGTLLGRFTWPKKKPIEAIKNGYLYTRQTNKDTDIQEVVRYRIQMSSKSLP